MLEKQKAQIKSDLAPIEAFPAKGEAGQLYGEFIGRLWQLGNENEVSLDEPALVALINDDLATATPIDENKLVVTERETILGKIEYEENEPDLDDTFGWYIHTLGNHRLLTREEEINLSQLSRLGFLAEEIEAFGWTTKNLRQAAIDGQAARNDLALYNQKLVLDMAQKVARSSDQNYDQEFVLELAQAGNLGLQEAIRRFDPNRGSFSNCATWWMRNYVKLQLIILTHEIGLTIYYFESLGKILRAKRRLKLEGIEATPQRLSQETGVGESTVSDLLNYYQNQNWPKSLDLLLEQETETDTEFPLDESQEEAALILEKKSLVQSLLEGLPENEAQLIKLRFGFESKPLRQSEAGKKLGVSRQWVTILEKRAMKHLREAAGR